MKALISPQENNRICEVAETDFPIALPLFWVDCPSDCTAEWIYVDGRFIEPIIPQPGVPTAEENKQQASQLLLETDWVNQPDVEPLLTNRQQFLEYRTTIRQYVIVPQVGNVQWPQKPQAQWSQQ